LKANRLGSIQNAYGIVLRKQVEQYVVLERGSDTSIFPVTRNIPNLLTLLRMCAAPVLILFLMDRNYGVGALIFLIAGITDALDGWFAKRFDCITRLGTVLDPIADKMLIITAYIVLALLGDISLWLVLIVGFRDLGIVGGYLILQTIHDEMPPHPSLLSKLNTFAQITFVLTVMTHKMGWVLLSDLVDVLLWLVAVTTLVSGFHYIYLWFIRGGTAES
jgi:cardiolipin synthase